LPQKLQNSREIADKSAPMDQHRARHGEIVSYELVRTKTTIFFARLEPKTSEEF
jgi:hypothetical protein